MWHLLNLTPIFIIVTIVATMNINMGQMPGDTCEESYFDCGRFSTGLECDHEKGVCGCLANLSYFDNYATRCYIQQGGTCPVNYIPCTPNSNCDSQGLICICEPEYTLTLNNKCAKGYNSTCENDSDCDVDKYFECVDTICQCPNTAKFDPIASHCITNIGERCYLPPTPCTRNATCNDRTRICECDEPFVETDDELCRIPYDELCTESQYCDEKKYLICQTGVCLCEDRAIYDEVEETCKILVDQECEDTFLTGQLCVNHATCKKNHLNQYVCLCDDTFSQSATHCYRSYGQICDDNSPCSHELFHECIDQVCRCHVPEYSWYNTTTQNCSLLAGASCGLDPNFPMNCIKNSYCAPRADICTCSENMTPNDNRFCVLSHDQLCDSTYDNCDSSQFFMCDPTLLRCSCINPGNTLWDPTVGACKLRAGQICNDGGIPDCVSNSECVYLYPSQQFQCECIGNLIQSTFGKCVLPYGSSCTPGPYDLCNDDGHQRCRDGHCLCTDDVHMAIDLTDNNCYLTWNSPCHADGVFCFGNLTCSSSGFCQCDESLGFANNGDGQCVGGWGSRCDDDDSNNNGGCSVDHLLRCVEGTCECLPSYSAIDFGENNSSIKCLGNEGVFCESKMDCNTNASLSCNSGRCSCYISDEQFYDPVAKKCFVKMNGRCHLMSIPEQIPLFCDPQYTCKPTNDTNNTNMGRCLCEAGNVERCSAVIVSIGQLFFVFIIGFSLWIM